MAEQSVLAWTERRINELHAMRQEATSIRTGQLDQVESLGSLYMRAFEELLSAAEGALWSLRRTMTDTSHMLSAVETVLKAAQRGLLHSHGYPCMVLARGGAHTALVAPEREAYHALIRIGWISEAAGDEPSRVLR